MSNRRGVFLTDYGIERFNQERMKLGNPTQKLIKEVSGLNRETIRSAIAGKPKDLYSLQRLFQALSFIAGQDIDYQLKEGVDYQWVKSTQEGFRMDSLLFQYLLSETEKGYGCQVNDQHTDIMVIPPSSNLSLERIVDSHVNWVGVNFQKYWQASNEMDKLEQLHCMRPGEVMDLTYKMHRKPRYDESNGWYTELYEYTMKYACFEVNYGRELRRFRVSSSAPNLYTFKRDATPDEVRMLLAS